MARDRFGGFGEPAATPLQRYIQNACDPQNYEPNLALDLEIADLINSKKGTAPREAAMSIVGYANHRNPNVALLALTLLDICVKNCGYPFHLQISTKEFLNEMVRRFPERPPLRYSRVQNRVLELIEEWRQTICQTSKYKDDLGFIRDMHRLLAYKGYMFPEVRREDAAVLNPSDALKSAEEMEEEERAAQSAKLQELIRRGTPHDLQEANKLMKVMAGYDNRHKTDYRAKAAEEVGKVQQKARILEEMLQAYKPGDDVENDTWRELSNALASAQPKIQRMCEEESDDQEAVAKLLEINDSIHRTSERYRLIKQGDVEGASKIPKGTLGISGPGVRQGAGNELSLIDFDNGPPPSQAPTQTAGSSRNGGSLENDLLGLSLGDESFTGPSISLGGPSTATSMFPQLNPPAPSTATSAPAPAAQAASASRQPNYDLFNLAGGPSETAAPPPPPPKPAPATQSALDSLAALGSAPARQGSPFHFQQSMPVNPSPKPSQGLESLLNPATSTSTSSPSASRGARGLTVAPPQNNGAAPEPAADDEWTFSSALPDSAHEFVVTNTNINVTFHVQPSPAENALVINSRISNNTTLPVTELTFQLAVMKGYSLSLQPQSGRSLKPHQRDGITQTIRINGVQPADPKPIKVRWKASYLYAGQKRDEQGEIPSIASAQ